MVFDTVDYHHLRNLPQDFGYASKIDGHHIRDLFIKYKTRYSRLNRILSRATELKGNDILMQAIKFKEFIDQAWYTLKKALKASSLP